MIAARAVRIHPVSVMPIPESLREHLRLPVIAAPLFIVSHPRLVIEQCKAGVIGSFPALNARPAPVLEEWLVQITEQLTAYQRQYPQRRIAPFAVNQIVHASNDRLAHDVELCRKYRVPVQITSLRAPDEVVESAHSYGGLVFHDVTNVKHAKRALQAGVDGLILVCAGAGGHAGSLSPFALVAEVREFYDGPIILSGAIANGSAILAAQAMGADFAYMGTRFIATQEANATEAYKQALIDSTAEDVIYTNLFTGVHGNYLRSSIVASGLDPDALPVADKTKMNFGSGGNTKSKAWRDIWGSGQSVADIHEILPVSALVDRLDAEYHEAKAQLDRAAGGYSRDRS
jgi:nitronate monooxygenase